MEFHRLGTIREEEEPAQSIYPAAKKKIKQDMGESDEEEEQVDFKVAKPVKKSTLKNKGKSYHPKADQSSNSIEVSPVDRALDKRSRRKSVEVKRNVNFMDAEFNFSEVEDEEDVEKAEEAEEEEKKERSPSPKRKQSKFMNVSSNGGSSEDDPKVEWSLLGGPANKAPLLKKKVRRRSSQQYVHKSSMKNVAALANPLLRIQSENDQSVVVSESIESVSDLGNSNPDSNGLQSQQSQRSNMVRLNLLRAI